MLLLLAVFAATIFIGHPWPAGNLKQETISAVIPGMAAAWTGPFQLATPPQKEEVTSDPSKGQTPKALWSRVTPYELSVDASALVAEMCDLQLLAHGTGLALNSRQWSTFAAVVLRTQAIRQTYEAQIATSKAVAPGKYRVEIPVYPGAGDVLREKFNAELRTELGQAIAANVLAKLGDRLEARFAGFGVSVQTLDIVADPRGTLSDLQVTRTVTYWNSVAGTDQLTTRLEMHFPALEDPTGDSWSALLAMVKA